ncbi:MAG TPA: VWA domain-containing protein [Burkholderiaceae bacterium]|nr:VWA domain-containing protein [Burkholderiaceae bacterium]
MSEPALQATATRTLLEFAAALRAAGLRTDLSCMRSLFAALAALEAADLRALHLCGRLTLCGSEDDVRRYDRCFSEFFLSRPSRPGVMPADPDQVPMLPGGAQILGADPDRDDGAQRELEIGATSPAELLRTRKLAGLNDEERAQVYRLIARLRASVATRQSRRHRSADRGVIDVRQTARAAMAHAGEPDRLHWRVRRLRPRKRVLLLDISGSMAPYAGGLLRFGYAAFRCAPHRTEVFTIGTRLTRITQFLRSGDPEVALAAASKAIPDWCGGTRIADQLKAFLDLWGQRGMARGAVVVIASDGWERGDADLLRAQVRRLSSLSDRVIWANPHKSTPGFEPLTRGMQAALPFIDELVAGSSAQEFAELLDRMGAGAGRRQRHHRVRPAETPVIHRAWVRDIEQTRGQTGPWERAT